METRCEKCGAVLVADQAFCSKCGAVVGMGDAAPRRDDEGWDLATTMVGQQPPAPRPRPSAERQSPAARDAAAAAAVPKKGVNGVLLAVIGFVAVLAIAGLVLLLYLNSQG